MSSLKFSIIIPVKELNDYLKESIPKILNLDYDNYEIIILPNKKPHKILDYLKNKKIRIIPSGKVSPAVKRDIGAEKSRGKFLAFIDDDAYPKKNWLKIAEKIFKNKNVAAIGGPAITPENDSITQKASGLFFETFFGGGNINYRYKPAKNSFYVDDYPTVNLIVSKKAFKDIGGFDNNFWPGEDTKFCLDLTKKGYKIWYSNKLIVWHHRRKIFIPHLKQIANYAKHRGFFAKRFPKTSFKATYLMPSFFLLGNISLISLSFINKIFLKMWFVLIGIYFLLNFIDVFTKTSKLFLGFLTIITVYLTHLTYGFSFIIGLFSKNFKSVLR